MRRDFRSRRATSQECCSDFQTVLLFAYDLGCTAYVIALQDPRQGGAVVDARSDEPRSHIEFMSAKGHDGDQIELSDVPANPSTWNVSLRSIAVREMVPMP